MDGEGFLLGIALEMKVICQRNRRNPRYTQDGYCEIITVIECVSTAGKVLLPMYIYNGSAHLMGWHAGVKREVAATSGWSQKGWTSRALGLGWLERNFEKYTQDHLRTTKK